MKVKVCNLRSNTFESDFMESVVNTGFAVLTHHGIDHGLIRQTQQAWRLFFLNSLEYKNQHVNQENGNFGYKGMKSEKAVGAKVADLKEFFHWQPGQKAPDETFSETAMMFAQLEDVGLNLLSVFDKRGPRADYRESCGNSENTILRTLYYPAMDFSKEPDAVRAAAHEDINHITLLVAASAPGLQVLDLKGNWHDVPHEENSIVMNVGDMLQMASEGLYKSTTHRVINPDNSKSDRVSMPLFMHPRGNTILKPGKTAQQYLDERLMEILGKIK